MRETVVHAPMLHPRSNSSSGVWRWFILAVSGWTPSSGGPIPLPTTKRFAPKKNGGGFPIGRFFFRGELLVSGRVIWHWLEMFVCLCWEVRYKHSAINMTLGSWIPLLSFALRSLTVKRKGHCPPKQMVSFGVLQYFSRQIGPIAGSSNTIDKIRPILRS